MLRDATPKRREGEILRAIREYVSLCPGVVSFRQNTGALPVGDRFVRFGVEGFPDLHGSLPWCWENDCLSRDCPSDDILHYPRPFAFEVKRPGGKRSPAQLAMAATLEAAGWLYACVKSLEDVRKALGR